MRTNEADDSKGKHVGGLFPEALIARLDEWRLKHPGGGMSRTRAIRVILEEKFPAKRRRAAGVRA